MTRFLSLTTLCWAALACAHDYTAGRILVAHPWSRPTAPGVSMGVAYLSLENLGATEDVLLSASSPAAASVELHQTTLTDGVARMRPLPRLALPPGRIVKLEPGGAHMMLVGLRQRLEAGTPVPLTLEFRDAGKIQVMLQVEQR